MTTTTTAYAARALQRAMAPTGLVIRWSTLLYTLLVLDSLIFTLALLLKCEGITLTLPFISAVMGGFLWQVPLIGWILSLPFFAIAIVLMWAPVFFVVGNIVYTVRTFQTNRQIQQLDITLLEGGCIKDLKYNHLKRLNSCDRFCTAFCIGLILIVLTTAWFQGWSPVPHIYWWGP